MNIILHLGGNYRRATAAVELANKLKEDYLIVVSSEGNEEKFRSIYREAGIPDEKVIHDTAAWDTVTNFTHTYNLLRILGITKLYVVTDSSHTPRSMAIAERVWGGRVPIESHPRDDNNSFLERDLSYLKMDDSRAACWRWFGILFYWREVLVKRNSLDKLNKGHAFLEIGI